MELPLFGIGVQGKSPVTNSQRRLNLYYQYEKDQDRTAVSVHGTPGLSAFVDFGDSPVRGIKNYNNLYYVVHRNKFYSVNNAGTTVQLGTLNTSTGLCDMAFNGTEILVVDGTNGYLYNVTYNTFFQIMLYASGTTTSATTNKLVDSGGDFVNDGVKAGMIVRNTTNLTKATITAVDSGTTLSLSADIMGSTEDYEIGDTFPDGATTCEYLNTYFVVESDDMIRPSANNDGMTWDATEFAQAEDAPDGIVRVFEDHGELIIFGDETTEYWGVVDNIDFPFARIQGTSDEWGLAAKWSVAKCDNSYMYLAQNTMGQCMLVRSSGYTPIPIQDQEFHTRINNYSTVTDARAFAYLLGGHPMYQITFPTAGETWLYDLSTDSFSELKSNKITRHRADLYVNFLNKHYVTDYENGRIYELTDDVFTDNGMPILRQLRSRHFFSKDHTELIVDRLQLVMETGVGLASGQGSDPQCMLRISKDGGHSWGNELTAPIGAVGDYIARVLFEDMGSARDWVFELGISDPIPVHMTGINVLTRKAAA